MEGFIFNAIIIAGLLLLVLFLIFFHKKEHFITNYYSILEKVEDFNENIKKEQKQRSSRFIQTIEYLYIAFFTGIITIVFLWIEYHTSPIIAYILSPFSFAILYALNYQIFATNTKGVIIFILILLPLYALFFYQENYVPIMILNGLLVGVGISLKWDKFRKNLKLNLKDTRLSKLRIFELFNVVQNVADKLSSTNRFKEEIVNIQALVIAIALIIFVILPRISFMFSQNLVLTIEEFNNYIIEHKDIIPVFVLFGYLILSIGLSIEFINKFYTNEKNSFNVILYNFLVFTMMFFMMIPYTIISMFLFAIIVGLGNLVFGIDFAIILGFFIFPNWIARLHSYQIAIFILTFPNLEGIQNNRSNH